jgi:diguanylate cyclase (GGDEF)-like protein
MSLKLKVSLILLAVFAGLFATNALVLRVLLWPSFEKMDLHRAGEDVVRVEAAFQADAEALFWAVQDRAAQEDAQRYAQGHEARLARHLTVGGEGQQLQLVYVIDAAGTRVEGSAHAPLSGEPLELALLPRRLPPDHFLRPLLRGQAGVAGLVATERGPLLLAAHPLSGSKPGSPAAGLLVIGRFVTDAAIANIGKRVDVEVDMLPMAAGPVPVPGHPVLRFDDGHVDVTAAMPALIGPPAMVLHMAIPRDISASGASAINYTLAALIVTAGVVMLVVLMVVQYLAVNPLARLSSHVRRLAETGNLAEPLHEEREDEFGFLAREFNRMQWRVSRLAFYDTLTDLPNRLMFTDHLRRALGRAERTGRWVAVFYLDLDGFKNVNDTLSHAAGDALLRQVAQRFRANLRSCDIIARLGGDEFTVLVEDLQDEEPIGSVANKILGMFAKPFTLGQHSVSISASIGVSLFPRSGATVDELMLAADIAMYRAKRGGPGRYHVYNDGDHAAPVFSAGAVVA